MVRVMVVDDEPAAMGYITSLLQSKCADVEIVSQAEDGREAIDALADIQADIVITDIQMAGVNGIELAQWISRFKPGILTLIISGPSDFEYAKDAIHAGVVEYLLKPIRPLEFVEAMKKLTARVKLARREERERWLRRAFIGDAGGNYAFSLWRHEYLLLGVVRLGAVFDKSHLLNGRFDYPPGLPEDLAAVYIHDDIEICFALPFDEENVNPDSLASALSGTAPYYTSLYKIIAPGESCLDLTTMLAAAQKTAVPGLSRTAEYNGAFAENSEPSREEHALFNHLRFSISSYQMEQIIKNLSALFALWEKESRCMASIELTLIRLFQLMAEQTPHKHNELRHGILDAVKDICRRAAGFSDMLRLTLGYCEKLFWSLECRGRTGKLAEQIEEYIQARLEEPLSTQQMCAAFGISVSYLSQLFRKNFKMSFVEYVTKSRIEKAKRMILEFPDMPIKDIAAQTGFPDPFYFSKVFRSLTGVPPSEYKSSVGFSM